MMSNQKRLRPSGERRARLRHPVEPNMMGLLASESREITKHPPGETLLERPSCHVSPGETICSPACLQTHGRNRCKMGPGRGPGAPTIEQKSVPGPSWDTPWRHRECRKHLGSVPEASWGIPGVPRQRPKGSPSAPRDTKKDTRRRAGACRGVQNRRQVASGSEKNMFVSRDSLTKHCRSDFLSILVDLRRFRKVCEPSETS